MGKSYVWQMALQSKPRAESKSKSDVDNIGEQYKPKCFLDYRSQWFWEYHGSVKKTPTSIGLKEWYW